MAAKLQEAIGLYEKAANAYKGTDLKNWASTQINLGDAYARLPTGDRAANLQKAIDAYQAVLRVKTEKDFPADWAATQINLGIAYSNLPAGDRARESEKCESVLQVSVEGLH